MACAHVQSAPPIKAHAPVLATRFRTPGLRRSAPSKLRRTVCLGRLAAHLPLPDLPISAWYRLCMYCHALARQL